MQHDRTVAILSLALAVAYLFAVSRMPSPDFVDPVGPRVFPAILGVALLLASVLLFLERRRHRSLESETGGASGPKGTWRSVAVFLAVALWTGAYFATFESLGYLIATFVYLLALMQVFSTAKWYWNTATAAAFCITTHVLFTRGLEVILPSGLLVL